MIIIKAHTNKANKTKEKVNVLLNALDKIVRTALLLFIAISIALNN